jgi:hypothetical protein
MDEREIPGLPNDWRPPQQVLLERAWDKHERHDELVAFQRERDEQDQPKWFLLAEPDEGDPEWTAVWFRPVDPLDERPGIRIVRYPNSWLEGEDARVQAIIDEHFPPQN